MTDFLGIYLNDHLMGATGGLELFKRAASHLPEVDQLVEEIAEDRDELLRVIELVGARQDHLKVAAGWLGEKLGRFKLNGALVNRSPLSDLIELEALTLGVAGKLSGWRLLRALEDPRLGSVDLDELIARAERQLVTLDAARLACGAAVLAA